MGKNESKLIPWTREHALKFAEQAFTVGIPEFFAVVFVEDKDRDEVANG